jgi:signal transduction histidine kinase
MNARRAARIVLAFAVIAALPSVSAAQQDGSHRTVLTIHWGPETFPSNPILDAAIRQVLTSRPDLAIDYFAEYLDSDRFPAEEASLALVDYIQRKYRGRQIDLVIAMSDPVLRFVLDHREQLFPDAPIVATGAAVADEQTRGTGASLTGVAIGTVYAETLRLVLTLHPSVRQVFVVARGSDPRNIETVRAALSGFSPEVTLTHIAENTLPRLLTRVKEAPPGSVILYVWHSQEEPGHVMYADQVARLVSQAASVPVYGTSDLYIGTGIIGGIVRGTRETGIRVGEMALRILEGARPEDMPIEPARLVSVFDWRAMQRWGIDESQLPPFSIVSFRAPSLWRDYRRQVFAVLGSLALQSLLIIGLLYQRRARRKAEVESRRNLELAADANRRVAMTALTGSIAHDLSQPLNSILHDAQAASMLVGSNRATPEVLQEILRDIRTADVRATEIIQRHRTMIRSRELDKRPIDIHAVVRESLALVDHDMRTRQIQSDVTLPAAPCLIVGDQVLLQQVLVNLVINAMDAMAQTPPARRRLTVQNDVSQDSVEVSVCDAGSGLPAESERRLFEPFVTTKANGMGIGLTIAQTIVEAHSGRIEAHNNPDGGATFTVTLPRARRADQ